MKQYLMFSLGVLTASVIYFIPKADAQLPKDGPGIPGRFQIVIGPHEVYRWFSGEKQSSGKIVTSDDMFMVDTAEGSIFKGVYYEKIGEGKVEGAIKWVQVKQAINAAAREVPDNSGLPKADPK